ncbi:MAG: hypothetical protein DRJ63_06660 [Thermoprotei archaeon]|nr:MAG: hypothetical protein DRJ63_06660 [Thermoprotei archaeon]
MLIDEAALLAERKARDLNLETVDTIIGVKYCYVSVRGSLGLEAGVSFVPLEDLNCTEPLFEPPSPSNIVEYASSTNPLWKTAAVAYINAVSQYLLWKLNHINEFKLVSLNLIDMLSELIEPENTVVVIGNMEPIVRKLKNTCRELYVLERNPKMRVGENVYADTAAPRLLGKADVVIVTGATLVNDTIDHVLALSSKARFKIVVGPTAGIYPEIFFKYGVDYVASLKVVDYEKVKKCIMLGGGRWNFGKWCKDYVFSSK